MPVQPDAASWTKQYASGQTASWTANKATWVQVVGAGTVVLTNEDGTTATMICAGGEVFPGVFTALVSTNATYVNAGNGEAPPALVPAGAEESAATSLTTRDSAITSTVASADTSIVTAESTTTSALTSSATSLTSRDSAITSGTASTVTADSTTTSTLTSSAVSLTARDSALTSTTTSSDTSLTARDSVVLSTALSAAASAALA